VERVVKESGDFTAGFRLVGISAIAVVIGAVCAVVALGLLRMIELFTNLFYFQGLSVRPHLPAANALG
jgi:CIC family chloride channel protein